eukprot:TRINITY_DN27295_c0_g1_i5.p2 TRINITY_DN27295_c0_g1~~TRINITY_DN27295_c0_g1_i5.p2  ORF type:complete len:109 (-),score=8.52 TRINITY_DN27295_c0_g1_i5:143-469(-)
MDELRASADEATKVDNPSNCQRPVDSRTGGHSNSQRVIAWDEPVDLNRYDRNKYLRKEGTSQRIVRHRVFPIADASVDIVGGLYCLAYALLRILLDEEPVAGQLRRES